MRLIKYIGMVLLFAHCNAEMPHAIIGKWQVEKYEHSIDKINKELNDELAERAASTTYSFRTDFTVLVKSGYSDTSKKGAWYWDSYRKKLVINEEAVFEAAIDTIFIEDISTDHMIWVQSISATDKNYIHLKKIE